MNSLPPPTTKSDGRDATLFLTSSLNIGGSERKIVRLVNALVALGRTAMLAYLNEPDTLKKDIDPRIPVHHLERMGKLSFSAAWRLRRLVKSGQIRRIVCVNLYPLLYAFLATGIGRSERPSIIALVNTTDFNNAKEEKQMAIYAPLLRSAAKRVFGSHCQQKAWLERYHLPDKATLVIHNGVNADHFSDKAMPIDAAKEFRSRFNIPDTCLTVGMVGQLRPEKQQSDLIRAARKLLDQGRDIRIVLVGDGECRTELEQLVAQSALQDHVIITGAMADVRPALAAMNVFALTSVAVETFSNAALEAMSMGKPVVLSAISGAPEMVTEGENGFLYPPGDVERLTEILGKFVMTPELLVTMGETARLRVQREFTFEAMVARYDELLHER